MKKIEPLIRKIALSEDDDGNDLAYWLGRTPEERIEAMALLREHHFAVTGHIVPPRIEKIVTRRPL